MTETQSKRRWFAFGLRTLFVAVTILAVFCAWFVSLRKWVKDRQEARTWIMSHHGVVIDAGLGFLMTRPGGSRIHSVDGITTDDGKSLNELSKAPISLRLLGEKSVHFIYLSGMPGEGDPPIDFQERDAKLPELRSLFPEAEFVIFPPGQSAK